MSDNDIAIVGMAAHLPGARSTTEYWQTLSAGIESIRDLSEEELIEAGVSRTQLRQPGYVRSAAILDDVFQFDADFFGLSPKEAGIMDPQHRHFLMAAWEALEDAGHPPSRFPGAVGVFAGCGMNSYFMQNVMTNADLVRDVGPFLLRHTGNDKDFLATRASYLFNLRGPSINVQTACSTSLVATHLAVQSLLSGECDLALAGGVTIELPHGHGYQYEEGEILSPDGHCRAFDQDAAGTVFGSGTGVVALRRLDDALDDGDQIYAVIKGTAVNNDGAQKVGYLAPSVDGQAACIAEALAVAEVDAETLSYVECHGTGTPMGDPIELAALRQAFGADSGKTGYCRIGSVKTNIGHLDTAAGVASLIKVALSLQNHEIPASLNFTQPNAALELDDSPFLVNDKLSPWPNDGDAPRRAGVNSLGVGGTNAFAVLEEAPPQPPAAGDERLRLITITGRSRGALDANTARLAEHLRSNPQLDLADVAWTLQVGRHHFAERRVLAARTVDEAVEALERNESHRVFSHSATEGDRQIAFMFPGAGIHHPGMSADLYASEPVFAQHVDEGLRLLKANHRLDLARLLFPQPDDNLEAAAEAMEEMVHQLPLVFIVEHALAQLLISQGLRPRALLGHSLGENTAACVAGTISFEDCLGLVVLRGRLFGKVPGGALAAPVPASELAAIIAEHDVDLAIVNSPDMSVVSGASEPLARFAEALRASGVDPIRIPIPTAPHSRLLEPVLDEFRAYLQSIELSPPAIPWVSNRTGTWISDHEATDPEYWVSHLRHTVMFSDCIDTLAQIPDMILLEVGPRRSLTSIVRSHPAAKAGQVAIPLMRHPEEDVADDVYLLTAIGRIWAAGGELDTESLFDDGPRRRIRLPSYAFQNQLFKIEPGVQGTIASESVTYVDREPDQSRWYWKPVWRSQDLDEPSDTTYTWLVLVDQPTISDEIIHRLRARGDEVVVAHCGDSFKVLSENEYLVAPELGLTTYESLVLELSRSGKVPDRIAHLALLTTDEEAYRPGSSFFHRNQELGFQSLVLLAQAWAASGLQRPLHISVATAGAERALPSDRPLWPEQSTVLGPVLVIPREFADITVSTFDLDPTELDDSRHRSLIRDARFAAAAKLAPERLGGSEPRQRRENPVIDAVLAELLAPPSNVRVAIRRDRRLVHDVRRIPSGPEATEVRTLRHGAAVLITGGAGGIGFTVAETLVESHAARIALLSRSALPDRDSWDELLARLGPKHPTAVRIRRVRALEAKGAEVLLLTGDVTDVVQVETAVQAVRQRFGSLDAVIHAAGTVADDLIVSKDQTEMDDVLAPKVYGTLILEEATSTDDLDLFVVFSSTSTVSAPIGQVDYVAANAFLNAWAAARRSSGAKHVLSLNWGVWQEIGMAAASVADGSGTEQVPTPRPAQHPLFEDMTVDHSGVVRLRSRWSADHEWFLDDHRTEAGDALLPGTGYIEIARAALAELGLTRPFEIRGLTFLRPLVAPDGVPVDVETVLVPTEEGYAFSVRELVTLTDASSEDAPLPGRSGWRRTAEASLLLYRQEEPPTVNLDAMEATCPNRAATRTAQQDHLRFGPRWDVVQRVKRGSHEAMAWLELADDFAHDLDQFELHPALIDLGTGFAMELIDGYTGDTLWVPVDYQRVRVFQKLPQEVIALARVRPTSGDASGFATFDVTICAPDGTVCLLVTGFTMKRLTGPLDTGRGRPVLPSDLEPVADHQRSTSKSELTFLHNLSQGIRPAEGKVAFTTALAIDEDIIYATSMDLPSLRRQSEAAAAEQQMPASSSAVFGRPDLDAAYVEPRNDIEENLVTIWQELLGIDQIGVDDNFFDLGGHSLIAVRLFAKVKRTFGVEFPISVLFEAPTIAACAALIAEALPESAEPDAKSDDDPPTGTITSPRPRYQHLVAMHPGEGGPKTPFFLVAGMFGNVLNLRHLAHLIGTDRPFYGVQARGVYGEEAPHEDFTEMASAYLDEVQQVQPRGPYLLGGFSGGGITALEMARMLQARGQETALLVMLDTPVPETEYLTTSDKVSLHAARLRREGLGYLSRWVSTRLAWEREVRRRQAAGPAEVTDDGSLNSQAVMEAFYRALAKYEPRFYSGSITLLRPKQIPMHVFGPDRQIDENRAYLRPDNGWGPYCNSMQIIEVPGDHDSMVLEPNVRVLASHIRNELDRLDQTSYPQPGIEA